MKIDRKEDGNGSWTIAMQSSCFREFVPGILHPSFGIALLWYMPEKRLSVSIWHKSFHAKNWRLFGPKKLSWER